MSQSDDAPAAVVEKSVPHRYGAAVLCAASAMALRWGLDPALGDNLPLSTSFGFVALSVWYAGWGPAVLTAALCYVATNWLFIEPRYRFSDQLQDHWGIAAYLSSIVVIIGIGEAVRRTRRRAAAHEELVLHREQALEEEIQERRRAQAALQESDERLRVAQHAGRVGSFEWNIRTGLNTWTPELEAIYGLQTGEFAKTQPAWEAFLHPADKDQILGAIERSLTTTDPTEEEFRIVRPDGTVRSLIGRWQMFRDPAGNPLRLTGVNVDITERKESEEARRESDARFRLMADASPVLIWISGFDRQRTYFNKGWLDFTGRTLEQETGIGWNSGVHPDDQSQCLSLQTESFDKREPFEAEFRLRRFDGAYRWILDRGIPWFDENGAFLGYVGSSVDITDLKQAQDALRDNEQRLSGIITSAMDAIITIDEQQRITDFNNAAETMFACSTDVALGQSIDRFLPQSFQALHAKELKTFTKSTATPERRKGVHGTVYGRRVDGEEFPLEASFSQLQTATGKFYTIILRDVTQRLWQEQALRHSEGRYRDLIQALPAAVYTCDERGRITLYNQAAVALWGREPEMGKDLWCGSWKIYATDGRPLPLDECPMAVTLREGRPIRGREIVIERPDGTKRHVLPHPEPIWDDAGKVMGGVNMLVDITESKRAEHALGQLAAIVKSSDDAIISKDLRGIVTSWNGGAERLFGYTEGEMLGQSIYRLIPLDRHDEESSILRQLARGAPAGHYDTIRVHKDGTAMAISLAVSPILDAHGNVVSASSIARDITEKTRAEEALRERDLALTVSNEALVKQKAALAEANKELESFSYSVSHDLRAPLRTIDAFIRILEEDHSSQLSAEAQRCLRIVRQAAGRAGELIDDLLEFSRLGRLGIDFRSVAMTDLARAVAEEQHLLHQGRAVELIIPDLPPCHGDWRLLKLVWTNLLSNAFKYTKTRETALVTVGWLPDDQQAEAVVYYVKDNGVGFDMKYVHKLFGVFQRLHLKEDFEGTGVGLAIVHRIVHRHRGRVWAEGKVDGGATFYFSLRKALRP
ncbi:MAG: hypothetical protein NTNFB02_16530 [Nitrospira sp.]